MTTEYEEYQELVTKQKRIRTICDRCGKTILEPDIYEVKEFELRVVNGYSYPEVCRGQGWEVEDLCDDCILFLTKLLLDNDFKRTLISY